MPNHPSTYPSSAYSQLSNVVQAGYYRRFDDRNEIPPELSSIAAFPSAENYRTSVIMGSGTTQGPPSIGGITPAPQTTIYRVSTIRFDLHDGQPHFNRDDILIFKDTKDRAWQLHAQDQPGHYESLSIDSGLSAAIDIYKWPAHASGTLGDIHTAGGLVDFSTGRRR